MKGDKIIDLYTPKDVKEVREQFLKAQDYFDPILFLPLTEKDCCLDHDHTTQLCRGALHKQSNAFEGLVANAYKRCIGWLSDDSLPNTLRRLATYLETEPVIKAYHPAWIKRVTIDFKKLDSKSQEKVLKDIGATSGTNAKQRVEHFRKKVLKGELGFEFTNNKLKGILNE